MIILMFLRTVAAILNCSKVSNITHALIESLLQKYFSAGHTLLSKLSSKFAIETDLALSEEGSVFKFIMIPCLAALTDNLLNQVSLNLLLVLVNQGSLRKYDRVNVLASQFCSSS